MAKDAEIIRIAEVRGKDGSTAYEIHGGKHGEGETSYYLTKEAMRDLEKGSKHEREATLRRGLETAFEGRKGQD